MWGWRSGSFGIDLQFQNCDRLFTGDSREMIKELVEWVACIDMFPEDGNGNPGAGEAGGATHDFRVDFDDICGCGHWITSIGLYQVIDGL
jgi:hypothetical protein